MLIPDSGNKTLLVKDSWLEIPLYVQYKMRIHAIYDELNYAWVGHDKRTSTLLSLLLLYFVACCH